MRRIGLVLMATAIFCLGFGSGVMAAIDPPGEWVDDHWYSVEEEEDPFVNGSVSSNEDQDTFWEGAYYRNDQTFFGFAHHEDYTLLRGSYLWESGFFLGLQYEDEHGYDATMWRVSPGYRWNLDRGYLAFSLNLGRQSQDVMDGYDAHINQKGLDVSWVYYPTNMKIKMDMEWARYDGSASSPRLVQTMEADQFWFEPEVNFKITDSLVVGARAYYQHQNTETSMRDDEGEEFARTRNDNDYSYELGFTWEPKYFILNASVGRDKGQDGKSINAEVDVPFLDHFSLGFEYYYYSDDGFDDKSTAYHFKYRFKEDYAMMVRYRVDDEMWMLGIHKDL